MGWSLNAVQNINDTCGLFARVNGSIGSEAEIERSAAFGGVGIIPFMRNPDDQLGLGVAWKTANAAAFPGQATQSPEVAIEGYWNLTVGKLCQIGLHIQIVPDPGAGTPGDFFVPRDRSLLISRVGQNQEPGPSPGPEYTEPAVRRAIGVKT